MDEVKLQQFVQYYAPQVKTYAKAWSETFGYPVKEAGLFFATVKQYIKM